MERHVAQARGGPDPIAVMVPRCSGVNEASQPADTLRGVQSAALPLPKSRKGRQRHQQILETAMRAFAVQGYRKVSLATIATEVGITEQGAMHYFPTKEHLLIGVLEYRDERDTENLARLAERHPDLTLLDVLAAQMRHNIEEQPALAALYSVLMAESVDPEHAAHAWFTERNRRVRAQLAEGVAQAQARDHIRADLGPADVAAQIVALFDGLALQWSLDPQRVDAVGAMRSFLQSLCP